MSRYTDKLFHFLDKTMETCSAIILAGMTLLIFIQVLARYIFKTPLAWSEEGARFLFIWMTFIAGYVGARKGQHIGVELIQNLFPAPIRMGMKVICDLLSAFFSLWYYTTVERNGENSALRLHRPFTFQWLWYIWE